MKKIIISTSSFNLFALQNEVNYLNQEGYQVVVNPFGRKCTQTEIGTLLGANAVGLIGGVEPLTRDVLLQAKNLQVISRCGIGLDNVDLPAAKELKIDVYNTPCAPIMAVAELAVGFMLCLLRKIVINNNELHSAIWKPQLGNLLSEQTVGIVGYGKIGQKVTELLKAYGSRVLIHDPWYEGDRCSNEFVDISQLLKHSKLVSLHISGLTENHHFIDENKLSLMPKGSYLINTARGGIVDEHALYNKVVSAHLAGAALDVFENEPYDGPLAELPQVLLTSHIGSYAQESRSRMESEAMKNLILGLKKKGHL